MPFWGWLLIDLGILLVGGFWLTYLLWVLFYRGRNIVRVMKPMFDALEKLEPHLEKLESRLDEPPAARSRK